MRSDKQTVAWDLFNRLREKILPSPEISATMIMSCGKNDYVEKAFKVYKELLAQGLTPNSHTHSALIYAGSKRKEFYPQIVDLFKEMQSLGMSIDIRVYNHLLVGCGKVADLQTALSLWDQLCSGETNLFPTEVTVANMLWALASVETEVDKISLRQFHYDMNPEELKKNAEDVYDWAVSAGLPINGYVKNAFLAVMTNHVFVERAEQIFKDLVSGSNKDALPHSYELMLKLYDSAEDYPKSQALILNAQATGIKLSFEAWRAGVRTAALTDHLEESVETLQCMVNAGHRPSVKDIKALHLRLCENEKWTLKKRMDELCLPPVKPSINPFTTWRQRSVKLHNLLKDVYGKEAPSLTTKIDKGIDSGPL